MVLPATAPAGPTKPPAFLKSIQGLGAKDGAAAVSTPGRPAFLASIQGLGAKEGGGAAAGAPARPAFLASIAAIKKD